MNAITNPAPCSEPWSYNHTLAILYRYGIPVALVTPDGHKSISPGLADMLIGLLNKGEAAVEPQNPAAPPPAEPLRWRPGPPPTCGWWWMRGTKHSARVMYFDPEFNPPYWDTFTQFSGPILEPMEGGG